MFKVRATVVGFDKDENKYPCHFRYAVGDEITYDGESYSGKVCSAIAPELSSIFMDLFASGGRHREGEIPAAYFPFWHASLSVYDPAYKIYDGVGFKPVLEMPEEGYRYIPDETLYNVPPGGEYRIGHGTEKGDFSYVCLDKKTLVRFKVEAFDLADRGHSLPYFRRSMSILDRIPPAPGIAVNGIINEFDSREISDIYPTLGLNIIAVLTGALELLGYVSVKNGQAARTAAGERKLAGFKASLSAAEKDALRM
ncbi:hypothetical protein ACFLW1_02250 [Chloroflexota bacterium]